MSVITSGVTPLSSISTYDSPSLRASAIYAGASPALALNGTVGAASRIHYYPIAINQGVTVTKLWVLNGNAIGGNTDLGIYGVDGIKIVSTGATLQAGNSLVQVIDVTDTYLGPGIYYLAMLGTSLSGAYAQAVGNNTGGRVAGMLIEAGGTSLPAGATFSNTGDGRFIIMGALLAPALVL